MTDTMLLNFSLFLYTLSLFVLIGYHLSGISYLKTLTYISITCGLILNLSSIVTRGIISKTVPLSNTYETIILFALLIAIIYLVMILKSDTNLILLTGCLIFIIILLALSSLFDSQPKPLVPALRSNWLTIHVLFCFISYSSFAIASIRSIIYLILREYRDVKENKFELINKLIVIGYTFLVLGIVTGSIWGESAWGSYWNWDPKETWSLITLLIYTIYCHLKLSKTVSHKVLSVIAIAGFIFILFTYFGINYLLVGLHSYA